MSFFSKNILFLRKKGKHTQAAMPGFVGIGRATWSNYENGLTEPDFDKLIGIARFFKVSIDDLLTTDIEFNAAHNENNVVNEPQADYAKKEQVNWLILQGINTLGEDIGKIKEKLGV
ncbi:helix-turn-helix domain-containing protein [Ferruginibacter profundus]